MSPKAYGQLPSVASQMMLSNTYSVKTENSLGYNVNFLYNFKIHLSFSMCLGAQLKYTSYTQNTTLEKSDTIYGFWYRAMNYNTTLVSLHEIDATILNIPNDLFFYHNRIDENGLLFLKSNLSNNLCDIQQIYLSFPLGVIYYPVKSKFDYSLKLLPQYLFSYKKNSIYYYDQVFDLDYLNPKKFNLSASLEIKYTLTKKLHLSLGFSRGIINSYKLLDIYDYRLKYKTNSLNLNIGYKIHL
ncbi:MAG: hypothetical protein JXB49_20045 [Bacteroidales bacterium]|nr:hypothetical protein [Bacteroidales bacterium]MBN2821376.1 hypothetical protein [Bacteroidales bacterium]